MNEDDNVDGDAPDRDQKESHRDRFHGHTVRHGALHAAGVFDKGFFSQGCIRKLEITPSIPNGVKQWFPDELKDGVYYSLKKKKRWQLIPSLIKGVDQYAKNEYKTDEDEANVKVSIREWAKVRTRGMTAGAVGFHSTDQPRHYMTDQTHCFDMESLKRKPKDGEVIIPHEIRYDVVYPPDQDWYQRRVPMDNFHRWDRMTRTTKLFDKGKGYVEDEFDEEDIEDEELATELPRSREFVVPIEDLIHTDRAEAKVPKTKPESQSSDDRKSRKVYLMRMASIRAATPTHPVQLGPESISRKMLITNETLDSSYLKVAFGIAHIEADCVPRRFVIDISNMLLEEAIKDHKIARNTLDRVSFESYLLFELDEGGTDSFSAVNVSAKIDCEADSLCIESLLEDGLYSIEAVVDMSVQFLIGCFFDRLKRPSRIFSETFGVFSIVDLANAALETTQRVTCVSSEEKSSVLFEKQDPDSVMSEYEVIVGLDGACCGICFAEINEECMNGTALKMCGHWFCDECWVNHVSTELVRGGTLVACPAYDCDVCANLATISAFADSHQLSLYRQRLEMVLFTEKYGNDVEYCPTPNCGAMLRASGVSKFGRAFTQCDQCKVQLCFECTQVPHWPATCEQTAEYLTHLKELGDDPFKFAFEPYIASGRNCPKCARFITKGEGCNHMTCSCKHQFCWNCAGDWLKHDPDSCLAKGSTLEDREIRHMFRSNEAMSDCYVVALGHRRTRAKGHWLALMRENKGRFNDAEKTFFISNRDWGTQMNLVHFCYLLHFVAEYTFVVKATSKKKDRVSGARDHLKFIADRLLDILQYQRDTLMKKEPERVRNLITYGQKSLERLMAITN